MSTSKHLVRFLLLCLIAVLKVSSRSDSNFVDPNDGREEQNSTIRAEPEVEQESLENLRNQIQEALQGLLEEGFKNAEERLKKEIKSAKIKTKLGPVSGIRKKLSIVRQTSVNAKRTSACRGLGILETSKLIKDRFNLSKDIASEVLESVSLSGVSLPQIQEVPICHTRMSDPPNCDLSDKYRRIDGLCNNEKKGAANIPLKRFLPADYGDGLSTLRGQDDDGNMILPNARTVSARLKKVKTAASPDRKATQMLKSWGQFLDHDITFTPESKAANKENEEPEDIPCCDRGKVEHIPPNDNCVPIDVSNDTFYIEHEIECLTFVRSLEAASTFGGRQQTNQITSFIDASNVYGSDEEKASSLRDSHGGRMKEMGRESGSCPDGSDCLAFLPEDNEMKFVAGDVRVNEQPTLTALHTLFLRYHNQLAQEFAKIDAFKGKDDDIYQECRRIVSAIVEHITTHEFLPMILDVKTIKENSLFPGLSNPHKFEPSRDPSIANVFATAAFRFGHTLVTDDIEGEGNRKPLRETFFDTEFIKEGGGMFPSLILKQECSKPSERADVRLIDDLVDKLFAVSPYNHGSDLMALNIMRGRDHGLPGYNAWREFCNLQKFTDFDAMKDELNAEAVDIFAELYENVDDVDLFPAALAEDKIRGGFLGPTFTCILAKQFTDLKFGDRFWYENMDQPHPFTEGQLEAIKNTYLSSVLCEATTIEMIQKRVMLSPLFSANSPKSCSEHTKEAVLKRLVTEWGNMDITL